MENCGSELQAQFQVFGQSASLNRSTNQASFTSFCRTDRNSAKQRTEKCHSLQTQSHTIYLDMFVPSPSQVH